MIGIDFVEDAILGAQSKAAGRNWPVAFLVKDAAALEDWDMKFKAVVDSGLLRAIYDRKNISGD